MDFTARDALTAAAPEPLVPLRVSFLRRDARLALEEGQEVISSVVNSVIRSKSRLRLALSGAAFASLVVLLPGKAEAQFGIRGGPLGVARFAVGHV
ncbi:hypothetical protein QUT06_22710, partial [Xanthomonas citri pv. citri]